MWKMSFSFWGVFVLKLVFSSSGFCVHKFFIPGFNLIMATLSPAPQPNNLTGKRSRILCKTTMSGRVYTCSTKALLKPNKQNPNLLISHRPGSKQGSLSHHLLYGFSFHLSFEDCSRVNCFSTPHGTCHIQRKHFVPVSLMDSHVPSAGPSWQTVILNQQAIPI